MSSTIATAELTDDEIAAIIEVPTVVTMWGQEQTIVPAFVREHMGDGLQWIWLSPLLQRPNYWVLRIDSGWDEDNFFCEGTDESTEHLEDVYEAIAGEYGCSEEERYSEEGSSFPYVQIDGAIWGPYDFDRKVRL
jgi:hypothetical protein